MIRQYKARKPPLTRLKIAALLIALIVGVSIGTSEHFVFSGRAQAGPTDAELAVERQKAKASMPRLPADIEEKVDAARYPQLAPVNLVTDPFTGKGNLSSGNSAVSQRVSNYGAPSSSLPGGQPSGPVVPDINSRIDEWRKTYRAAREANQQTPEKTRIYLLSELKPIGKTNTNGKLDAWFRLEIENRNFSASVGAKFYDAELIGITDEGASFRLSNGSVRTLAWATRDGFITKRPPASRSNTPSENEGNEEVRQIAVRQFAAPLKPTASTEGSASEELSVQPYEKTTKDEADTLTATIVAPKRSQLTKQRGAESNTSGKKETEEIFLAHAQISKMKVTDSLPKEKAQDLAGAVPAPSPSPTPYRIPAPRPRQPITSPAAADKETERDRRVEMPETPCDTRTVARNTSPIPQPSPRQVEAAVAVAVPDQPAASAPAPKERESNQSPLCDPNYKAELIDTDFTSPITLGNLVDKFNTEFGANIILDTDVQEIPVRLTITNVPWTQFLRIILDLNDLGQICLDGRIVGIAKRSKLAQIEEQKKKSEPIVQEIFHLRYLQPTVGGRVNLAGQAQGGQGATIQSLEDAIRAILQKGDSRADVRRVPGRNELLVAATREQIEGVRVLIARVDRPGYQILITALVYTANENRLKDVGSQLAAVVGNVPGTNLGGFTSLPPGTEEGTGGNTTTPGGLNPGGIPSLGTGMQQPSNGLTAASPNATFGVTTVIGTAQFSYQLTLAQRRGVVNIQSRPFGIVTDGDTFDLAAGTQIPVVTSAIAGGAVTQTGNVQFIEASRIARITPQVAESEDGKPGFVTLTVQLENNVVDTSLGTFNGLPGVNRQSLQTVLRLRDGETAVIGGLSADSVSDATAKVPGLGDIPILGNLFKRKTNQENRDRLYFAITVQVIPQESPIINIPVPSDALTQQPPPPRAQRPSPFEKRR